jgi:DNA-binding SARP family transcriptional activator/pimeloyl-ACP methyl ester carboxylesterase
VPLSVLGPLRLEGQDGPVTVIGRKTREVLAQLALGAPRPLSVSALVERLWDAPPPSAVKTVQGHVSRARSSLAAARGWAGAIEGGAGGYRLVAETSQLDVHAIDDLRRRARVTALAGDDHYAAQLLRRARQLWRGEPELPATSTGEAQRARLIEEHLQLVEEHLAAMVAAGEAADTVAELEALTATHPLRERLWSLRMAALYRVGRQSDALNAYRDLHRILADEVGVEPGPEVRALDAAILAHNLPSPPSPPQARPVATRPAPTRPAPTLAAPTLAAPTLAADVPRYAEVDGIHVAYGIYGDGPVDVLLLNPTFVPVDAYLEEPHLAAAVAALATGRRVIAVDRRGLGLSDPVSPSAPPTLLDWVQDAVAVLDAAGAARVHVLANADTGLVALLLAAGHPDRTATVTVVNSYARLTTTADYPYGDPPAVGDVLRQIRTPGARASVDVLSWIAPSVAGDPRFRTWWDAVGRRSASPGTAEVFHRLLLRADVREALPAVTAPVLVLGRLGCASYDPGHGRYLVEHLADARLAEHHDADGPWFLGDVAWVLAQFAAFTR